MVPLFDEYIHPFLAALSDGKTRSSSEMRDLMAKGFNLTEEDLREMTKSGTQRQHNNRVNWAGTYLMWAHLVQRPQRGHYKITPAGLEMLSHFERITISTLEENCPSYNEMKKQSSRRSGTPIVEPAQQSPVPDVLQMTPLDSMEEAYNQMNIALAQELLETIKQKSPRFFENLVVQLLHKMGYGGDFEGAASVTQYSRDEGIDGIIKEDKLGLNSLFIQAKKWDNTKVGRKEIQSFVGALAGKNATRGVFITTADFSKEAIDYANQVNTKVVLMNGTKLCEYMIEYGVGVFTKRSFEIKRIDADFFEED